MTLWLLPDAALAAGRARVAVPPSRPLSWECVVGAAQEYALPLAALVGILATEGGKTGEARKKPEPTKFKCTCGKPLVRRESAKGPFFGCSGYPVCKKLYQVGEDGRPNFDAPKGGKK